MGTWNLLDMLYLPSLKSTQPEAAVVGSSANSFLSLRAPWLRCTHLPAVIKVPVGVVLQLLQLIHLVQHLMDLELGGEELQTPVGVSLTVES